MIGSRSHLVVTRNLRQSERLHSDSVSPRAFVRNIDNEFNRRRLARWHIAIAQCEHMPGRDMSGESLPINPQRQRLSARVPRGGRQSKPIQPRHGRWTARGNVHVRVVRDLPSEH